MIFTDFNQKEEVVCLDFVYGSYYIISPQNKHRIKLEDDLDILSEIAGMNFLVAGWFS